VIVSVVGTTFLKLDWPARKLAPFVIDPIPHHCMTFYVEQSAQRVAWKQVGGYAVLRDHYVRLTTRTITVTELECGRKEHRDVGSRCT
jgi:hypothetical protein